MPSAAPKLIIPAGRDGALLANPSNTSFAYDSIEEAFPTVDPGIAPLGVNVIVQIRRPKQKTKGGMILTDDQRSTEYYNTQVAKVIALGPLAFKTVVRDIEEDTGREIDTVKDWVSGAWFKVGDHVWVPKYGGVRFAVPFTYQDTEYNSRTDKHEPATVKGESLFAIYRAKDIVGLIPGDPLAIRCFYD